MNHRKIHDAIIARARRRKLRCYYEKHHIIPRSLKGSDDPSNIVALTYREHFLIHWLLTKLLTRGRGKHAMLRAFQQMTMLNGRRIVASWRIVMAKKVHADKFFDAQSSQSKLIDKANQRKANASGKPLVIIKGRHYRAK